MGEPRVLIVADGQGEAEQLNAILAELTGEGEVQVARSTADGLAALEKTDFEMLFAQLTSGPAGDTEFLNEVWKLRPRTTRFFVAEGVSAEQMVSSALGAHHFLPKPATKESLAGALSRARAISRFVRNDRIQSLVSRMRTLPSRPSLYVDVMRELRSQGASAETVGEIVAKDLAISTKLIQLVNSAFYALQQQVTDPAAAVLLVGFETTASLVLSIEAMARFDKVKPLYFSADRVWKHSQTVAQTARRITELVTGDEEMAGAAYTAGLLHDIGKLALALNFEEQYNGALKLAETQKLRASEVEKQVFGATHAEAGAYLLCVWGLPLPIVEAVADHHLTPGELQTSFSAATAVHLAERLHAEVDNGEEEKDLAYPEELGINHLIPEFRRIARGEKVGTEPERAKPAPLKAVPAPLSADGTARPLLNVAPSGNRKQSLIYLGAIALLTVLCWRGALALRGGAASLPPAPTARHEVDQPKTTSAASLTSAQADGAKKPVAPEQKPSALRELGTRLQLQAIFYKGQSSSMIINGQSFRIGDEIEGAQIASVEQRSVTLRRGGEELVMALRSP